LGIFKYSVTVTYNGTTLTDDPDVIVDNGSIGTFGTGTPKQK
jgi:hypothetical protein